ncbi:hypothetical protein LOTGIDRAFT_163184 [Lottia gigantea]|uniref:Uncharacterized protein n=1 Tax=Lottia gigantea TaxID=225164 RepID=V4A528_LOTGI|nr:hypothetical protein LOTGIDRAFT_163184 [Lottia gigantea]ESO91822.1 hypothetical protein LOTGIDRAFT_163184 [Lottia gigantea]
MNAFLDKYGKDTTTNFQLVKWAKELNVSPFYYCMRDEIDELKYKKESKNPMSSTAFINKAKPFFVDQIEDTLQGDIDMNNFKITNLKFPGNDNDAVNKKYLLDQINAIQIDKDHVENRITDVKRYFRRNIKNYVDEPKLQHELTSLKRLIQVDKTSQLQSLISKLDDEITKVKVNKIVFKQISAVNPVKHLSFFNDGNLEETIRLIDKRDWLYEIETKNGKYVDTFNMEVENNKNIIGIKDLDMILETENPPSTKIIKNPTPLQESSSYEFLRSTDFEYVKLYFALGGKYTSIDVHKSQQEREFIVYLSFAEDFDFELKASGFIFRAKINIEKEKRKYSYHLNEDHTKKEMSLVRVNVFILNIQKYNNAGILEGFGLSEIHLI